MEIAFNIKYFDMRPINLTMLTRSYHMLDGTVLGRISLIFFNSLLLRQTQQKKKLLNSSRHIQCIIH